MLIHLKNFIPAGLAVVLMFGACSEEGSVAPEDSGGQLSTWTAQSIDGGSDAGRAVASDAAGNVYVVGSFSATAHFGAHELTGAGAIDIFVAKYSPDGAPLWARQMGGGSDDLVHDIAVDGAGNITMTGGFVGTATFGALTLNAAGGAGDQDIFVVRITTSGDVEWAKRAGGVQAIWETGVGVALDALGNAYVVGGFLVTSSFGTSSLAALGSRDGFLAKYGTAGEVVWVQQLGSTGVDSGERLRVASDGSVVLTGYFDGSMTPAPGTTLTPVGGRDAYVARYTADGDLVWARSGGGTGTDQGQGITIDGDGRIYVTAYYTGTATFDGMSTPASAGSNDVALVSYASNGDIRFVTGFGGDGGEGASVAGASSGVYVAGYHYGSFTLAGKDAPTDDGAFLARISNTGMASWVNYASSSSYIRFYDISRTPNGGVAMTGTLNGTATVGADTLLGSRDAVVVRTGGSGW